MTDISTLRAMLAAHRVPPFDKATATDFNPIAERPFWLVRCGCGYTNRIYTEAWRATGKVRCWKCRVWIGHSPEIREYEDSIFRYLAERGVQGVSKWLTTSTETG